MVRLMLVLAPVMCILSGIAISASLTTYMKYLDPNAPSSGGPKVEKRGGKGKGFDQRDSKSGNDQRELIATAFVTMITFFLITYAFHCVWATSEAYSSPSIVLSARGHDGSRIIFDDFREAYWWLRMNTPEDAKVGISRLESYNDPRPSTNQITSLKNGFNSLIAVFCTYVWTDRRTPEIMNHCQACDLVCAWAWIKRVFL